MAESIEVDCCVAGGGPAGIMAGLLMARAGCSTLVLEKHKDFLRDFRGDTVHPSTLEVIHELGLLDAFLERPHQRMDRLAGMFAGERLEVADFSTIEAVCKFIAFMPQWHFLDFLSSAASSLPTFSLRMRAEATGLLEEGQRITGVRAETEDGPIEIRARLVIGADGRSSIIRKAAGLTVQHIGAPIDVLWFSLPRPDDAKDESLLNTGAGHVVITIDRGSYYQCAFVIPKGRAEEIKSEGVEALRKSVVATVPHLADGIDALGSFDDVSLLTVAIDRLERWSRPGLLMIGDAAHAMSPIGGVGINLAIQDAVAAANILAGRLAEAAFSDEDLDQVQKRRLWPVRATQFAQVQAQNRIIAPLLARRESPSRPPLPLRLIANTPWLRRKLASLIGLGVRPEHVYSPERHRLTLKN